MGTLREQSVDRRRDASARRGKPVPAGRLDEPVESLLDRWLASRTDVREVTRQGYHDVLVPVRHLLGDRTVGSLTTSDVGALVEWMSTRGGRRGQPLSARSIAASLGALAQALDLALHEEAVTVNVARSVERPRHVARQTTRWTRAQVHQFREHAVPDRLGAGWLLSLAGLRRAEVLGLRWQDVDLAGGRIRIEQGRVAVTPTSDAISEPTRGQERRSIQVGMVAGVLPALRQLRERQRSERRRAGQTYHESGLVVVDETGFPLRPAWYSDRFASLCRGAGVPAVPLRSLRCTAIDFLLDSGLHLESARDWLGQDPETVRARCRPDAARATEHG